MIDEPAGPRIGFMFDRDRAPEELVPFATALDELGADDLWVVEDLGWAGSISSVALALAATRRLRAGIDAGGTLRTGGVGGHRLLLDWLPCNGSSLPAGMSSPGRQALNGA